MAGNRKILSDPQVQADLLRAFKAGVSIEFACDVAGLSSETFYGTQRRVRAGTAEDWEVRLFEECQRARHRGNLTLLERIVAAGEDPDNWKANAWALSKMRRADFGADSAVAAAGGSGESKTREQLLAEVRAELDAMDATVPSQQPQEPQA